MYFLFYFFLPLFAIYFRLSLSFNLESNLGVTIRYKDSPGLPPTRYHLTLQARSVCTGDPRARLSGLRFQTLREGDCSAVGGERLPLTTLKGSDTGLRTANRGPESSSPPAFTRNLSWSGGSTDRTREGLPSAAEPGRGAPLTGGLHTSAPASQVSSGKTLGARGNPTKEGSEKKLKSGPGVPGRPGARQLRRPSRACERLRGGGSPAAPPWRRLPSPLRGLGGRAQRADAAGATGGRAGSGGRHPSPASRRSPAPSGAWRP